MVGIHHGTCLEQCWCWGELGEPPALEPLCLGEGSQPLCPQEMDKQPRCSWVEGMGISCALLQEVRSVWGVEFPWLWAGLCWELL